MIRTLTIDVSKLSERHIRALKFFIAKFVAGAEEHGDLEPDKDWTLDMLGEVTDLAFYGIFMILDRGTNDEKVHPD